MPGLSSSRKAPLSARSGSPAGDSDSAAPAQTAPERAEPVPPFFRILACSPRRNGNTDSAADLLRHSLSSMTGEVIRVADVPVQPCVSCGWCDAHPGRCFLSGSRLPNTVFPPAPEAPVRPAAACPSVSGDRALPLLHDLCAASVACVVSPVYFYHLPAQAKALVDRAQAFWAVPPADKPGQGRPLHVVLLGARPRGEKLFTGALLTLRYMAQTLGLVLADPLLLYGLDDARALDNNEEARERLRAYGRTMAARSAPPPDRGIGLPTPTSGPTSGKKP